MVIDVAVDIPVKGVFAYRVPERLTGKVGIGKRVIVPFGKRDLLRTGIVVSVSADPRQNLKEVFDVPDDFPLFTESTVKLARLMAERYASNLGETLFSFLPKSLTRFESIYVRLTGRKGRLTEAERRVVDLLSGRKEGVALSLLSRRVGPSVYRVVGSLILKGVVERYERLVEEELPRRKFLRLTGSSAPNGRRAKELFGLLMKGDIELKDAISLGFSRGVIRRLVEKGVVEVYEKVVPVPVKPQELADNRSVELTPSQKRAYESILSSGRGTFLLYGVTGSGKMEVYLKVAAELFRKGKSVLLLVPELLLTPELRARVESYFGKEIGVYHSRLSTRERVSTWLRVARGDVRVVLGTRMALMLPLRDLGLIVVDEEQDPSYKEQQKPYYSARDMAVKRGEIEGCPVILVSATPSVESYYRAKVGEYRLLELKERVSSYPLPIIRVVDLKREERVSIFSKKLLDSIENTVKRGEQVLLFINRRGYFSSSFCPGCGFVPQCESCAVPLTYHKSRNLMLCHVCGRSYRTLFRCPKCGTRLEFKGYGTERVEEELGIIFPHLKIVRFDSDTVRNHRRAVKLIKDVKDGKYDLIVGTQVISKGLNFPKLTLVAILMADVQFSSPDFRRSERIFQTVVHTTGRAGRFRYGAAIVQAFNVELPSIRYAVNYDFDGFYRSEIEARKIFNYPPFSYPVLLEFQLPSQKSFERLNAKFQNLKKRVSEFFSVPPLTPAPIPKVSGRYRFLSFLRASSEESLIRGVKILSEEMPRIFRGIRYKVVVEPLSIT